MTVVVVVKVIAGSIARQPVTKASNGLCWASSPSSARH